MGNLSYATLAAGLGVSRQAVGVLAQRGMPLTSVEAARAWRLANLDPSRTKAARMSMQAPAQGEPDDDPPQPDDSADYRAARTLREQIHAQRAQLELDRARGQVIDLAEATRLAFTAFRALRDGVLNVPARVKDQCAALNDPLLVEQLLDAELAAVLSAFSENAVLTELDDEGDA